MKLELNVAVIAWNGEEVCEAQPVKAATPEAAAAEYGWSGQEHVTRVCHLVLEDKESTGVYSHVASAYNAIEGLDAVGEDPRFRDMIMYFFMKGFKEGMQHQAEKDAKPVVVQK